jgi:hypothetical protein
MTKLLGTDDYEVKWATGYPLHGTQTDAAFYRDDESYICSVSRNGFSVDIYCDGDMKIVNRWYYDTEDTRDSCGGPSFLHSHAFRK